MGRGPTYFTDNERMFMVAEREHLWGNLPKLIQEMVELGAYADNGAATNTDTLLSAERRVNFLKHLKKIFLSNASKKEFEAKSVSDNK